MRAALHKHYLRVFRPGQRVLDVGCGTGTDALVLAQHGMHVLGVDGSAGMIAALQVKVAAAGMRDAVDGRVLAIGDLARLDERFDGAISSFAGLSTVDLGQFAADAARLIVPGGRMIVHLLNAFSVWEWIGLVSRRQWRGARELRGRRTRTFTIGGQPVVHDLYFAPEAYGWFDRGFRLRGAYSLGALRPPHTVRRLPARLVETLEWLDVRAGALPGVRHAGRFFVLDLERRL
jgi:SAM-dependent methyltransferase